jgi:glycosyltransferase involved in cell wall biosynthesis
MVLVHFISFDVLVTILYKKLYGYKLIFYAVGSDVLKTDNTIQQSFLKWAVSWADKVLCVNRAIEKRIKKLGNNKVVVIPTPFLEPNLVYPPCEKEYDVINVGALEPVKSQDLLIQSCKYMTRKITIAIVGEGTSRNYLMNLAKQYTNHKILFLGNLTHEQVWIELHKAKVYVHTSLREGLPSSILEATWCSLPVIAVKRPYTDDLTDLYGFKIALVEEHSPDLLAETIEKVLQNHESYEQIAISNKTLLEKFVSNWDNAMRTVLKNLI